MNIATNLYFHMQMSFVTKSLHQICGRQLWQACGEHECSIGASTFWCKFKELFWVIVLYIQTFSYLLTLIHILIQYKSQHIIKHCVQYFVKKFINRTTKLRYLKIFTLTNSTDLYIYIYIYIYNKYLKQYYIL